MDDKMEWHDKYFEYVRCGFDTLVICITAVLLSPFAIIGWCDYRMVCKAAGRVISRMPNNRGTKNPYDLSAGNRIGELRLGQRPPACPGANPYTGKKIARISSPSMQ